MSDEEAHEVVTYSEFRERRERRLRVATGKLNKTAPYGVFT